MLLMSSSQVPPGKLNRGVESFGMHRMTVVNQHTCGQNHVDGGIDLPRATVRLVSRVRAVQLIGVRSSNEAVDGALMSRATSTMTAMTTATGRLQLKLRAVQRAHAANEMSLMTVVSIGIAMFVHA